MDSVIIEEKKEYNSSNDVCESVVKKKKKKKSKVPKCNFEDCNNPLSIIIGQCKWCNICYCSQHRLPESHLCKNLRDCKDAAYDLNENKLFNQKTVCRKVQAI